MAKLYTALDTTLVVGDESIAVEISVDPDVQSLPVMLAWTVGGVDHQEEEFYASVPIALARVAALAQCCKVDGGTTLRDTPLDFSYRALTFLVDSIES